MVVEDRIKELTEHYQSLPANKMSLALPLIKTAAFIESEMEKLQKLIVEEGVVDEYQNGAAQFGRKQSANLQSYNSLVKSYSQVSKMLESMLPKTVKTSKLEEFMDE